MSGREVVKRTFDIVCAAIGLILLAPLWLTIALAVKLMDGGPVMFKQQRIGRHGHAFMIWKFRSMVTNAASRGAAITARGDPRITPIGRWLRRTKLDELPQLVNVLRGDMSFVGPRPEVKRYVDLYTAEQRQVLQLRPGITDLATLEFRNEEEMLAQAANVEEFYVAHCIPRKIELNLRHAAQADLWSDFLIIIRTVVPMLDRLVRRQTSRAKLGVDGIVSK